MGLYVNGIGCISPQPTFDNSVFLEDVKGYSTSKIHCVEPDYSRFMDAGSVRRLSRLAKFGASAALIALRDAGVTTPGAISTGTGYGLLENSEKFLKTMIDSEESSVSPTAFVQSTHNSISSSIALITGCHAHNNTFSQKGVSFESALIDAFLIAKEGAYDNILVGGYDELSEKTFAMLERLNLFRKEPCLSLDMLNFLQEGIIAGEGAAFFVLSKQKTLQTYGMLSGVFTLHLPNGDEEIENELLKFLERHSLLPGNIDVVISGLNGTDEHDQLLRQMNNDFFSTSTIAGFKHLCGEYMTAPAFALYVAAQLAKTGWVPEVLLIRNATRIPKRILIHNAYDNDHTFILMEAC